MNAVEFGLKCSIEDETRIVKNVNAFLATKQYRKMYKWEDKGGIRNIDDPESDPKLEYSYVQFMKQRPKWYFEIAPNVDLRDIPRFPSHPDCSWTLYFSKTHPELNQGKDDEDLDRFLEELLVGTGFECVLMHEYADDDYRR